MNCIKSEKWNEHKYSWFLLPDCWGNMIRCPKFQTNYYLNLFIKINSSFLRKRTIFLSLCTLSFLYLFLLCVYECSACIYAFILYVCNVRWSHKNASDPFTLMVISHHVDIGSCPLKEHLVLLTAESPLYLWTHWFLNKTSSSLDTSSILLWYKYVSPQLYSRITLDKSTHLLGSLLYLMLIPFPK